jgi:hypothetical protein
MRRYCWSVRVANRDGEAITLSAIGDVYACFGQKQKALDDYSKALPLERAVKDRDDEAYAPPKASFVQQGP